MFNLDEMIKERHSTRMFLPQPVPRDLVNEALALAQWAPDGLINAFYNRVLVCFTQRPIAPNQTASGEKLWNQTLQARLRRRK
jgi:hypothetical protein